MGPLGTYQSFSRLVGASKLRKKQRESATKILTMKQPEQGELLTFLLLPRARHTSKAHACWVPGAWSLSHIPPTWFYKNEVSTAALFISSSLYWHCQAPTFKGNLLFSAWGRQNLESLNRTSEWITEWLELRVGINYQRIPGYGIQYTPGLWWLCFSKPYNRPNYQHWRYSSWGDMTWIGLLIVSTKRPRGSYFWRNTTAPIRAAPVKELSGSRLITIDSVLHQDLLTGPRRTEITYAMMKTQGNIKLPFQLGLPITWFEGGHDNMGSMKGKNK